MRRMPVNPWSPMPVGRQRSPGFRRTQKHCDEEERIGNAMEVYRGFQMTPIWFSWKPRHRQGIPPAAPRQRSPSPDENVSSPPTTMQLLMIMISITSYLLLNRESRFFVTGTSS
ncbi:hypothetical protein PM082_008615 [Marasmius tenuissimus]|nr:hypothetical protein PM082_008615 [Marasmius tenuissimus]